jgi:type IV secretion system protein TrbG
MLFKFRCFGAFAFCCAVLAYAEQPPGSAKRTDPKRKDPSPVAVPDVLKQYNYAEQVTALIDPANLTPVPGSAPVEPQYVNTPKPGAPSDFKNILTRTDVPLTGTALEAVRVSDKWRTENTSPAAGPDGRVLYSYGAGLPTVVCAPLRVCIIELQAGEKIVGEPQIGDSVRWNISPALYGGGDNATSVIVLKPQVPGLDTNLLVTTDRRAYYLRLVSKPEDYVARVAFLYPEDDSAQRWQKHMAEQQMNEKQTKKAAEVLPAMIAAEKLNFGYRIEGGDQFLRPLRVYDDGSKTFIQMRRELQYREAPVLLVLGRDGKGEMTNYRVREQTYIIDRLFDRARLVLGTGKKAQKVEISRDPRG